ncbi:Polyketide synthesis cyclase [Frankia torreyi]|uniref:Polyketide synthesis cyclase n=1 Tax=Frankia torreyi TaxID=1856 RepID=A0A0D8BLQ1_9ACTN|nr:MULTISPECIES: TcmI family type II polyketide cyclase [Frankia]KJE24322.1 Polyketide synthesis cyclase [Frankia torreyi]KQC35668.1 polyketide synthase [Frankia sp. ACN1ag]KQM06802.1 Polyketide synthesis cyclase [Frankia sp. CpI1-P]MCM3922301.1 TcmI family type II polyketide cyclase [Frankia sp. AiPs1]
MPAVAGSQPAATSSGKPTHRTLIVARMNPADADAVAETFAESDAGELPGIVGVTRRELFEFHGLYFHLIDAPADIAPTVSDVRGHPLFVDVNTKLEKFITAYDPATWRGPRDAMARSFYHWSAG